VTEQPVADPEAGVIADKQCGVPSAIDLRHHAERLGPAPDQLGAALKFLGDDIAAVPVSVTDQDLLCPGLHCPADGGVDICRHPVARDVVLGAEGDDRDAAQRRVALAVGI